MTEVPEVVYLQAECQNCRANIDPDMGPQWHGADIWGDECKVCGEPIKAIKYWRYDG